MNTTILSSNISIEAKGISKRFNRAVLFRNIDFSVSTGESIAITGPNGSGKSTLLEIIACIKKPTSGSIEYSRNNGAIDSSEIFDHIGFASPRTNPYGDLTGYENINFAMISRSSGNMDPDQLLKRFTIYKQRNKIVRLYSSGMKQRLKLLIAILNDPPIILLDEPGTNLDKSGREIIFSYLESVRREKVIIIATNDEGEAEFCDKRIRLG